MAYQWTAEDQEYMGTYGGGRTAYFEQEYCTQVLGKVWNGPTHLIPEISREAEAINKERVKQWFGAPRVQLCGNSWCCTDGKSLSKR